MEISVESKDMVLLFTDGFTECDNQSSEQFGDPRFQELFGRLAEQDLSLQEIIRKMLQSLDEFRVPGPYPDDVTLLLIRRTV